MSEPVTSAIRTWWGPLIGILALAVSWGSTEAKLAHVRDQVVEAKVEYRTRDAELGAEVRAMQRDFRGVETAIARLTAEITALREELRGRQTQPPGMLGPR